MVLMSHLFAIDFNESLNDQDLNNYLHQFQFGTLYINESYISFTKIHNIQQNNQRIT